MTAGKKNDYVSVYYGIHMYTFEVQSAWVKQDGTTSIGIANHYVMPGRDVRAELMIVYNIADATATR